MTIKDKEKSIQALGLQIQELKLSQDAENVDFSTEIESLEGKIKVLEEELMENLTPWDRVLIARTQERPTALDYINEIFTDFMEFHGDRYFGDDPAVVGGIALLGDLPVTVIGEQKGLNTKDNIYRNFGMPSPEGYRKALRLMQQAEKFKRPIIAFVDTPGAFCGISAEERGQGEAIARNLFEMAGLKVPIISIVIGEGGSGGALAVAVADKIYMLENSIYSILSPEGFASILWKDSSRAEEAAGVMKITAEDLKELKVIDTLIEEPVGGAHKDMTIVAERLRGELMQDIPGFLALSEEELVDKRYERFRQFGEFEELHE